jgi:hypothetical protein
MKKQWFIALACVIAWMPVSQADASQSKSERVFCKVARSIDSPNSPIADEVTFTLTTVNLLKATFAAYYPLDMIRFSAGKHAKDAHSTGLAIDKSRLATGAMKAFIKSFIPTMDLLAKTLNKPDEWWPHRKGVTAAQKDMIKDGAKLSPFAKFYKHFQRFTIAVNVVGAGILAVRLAALDVCKRTIIMVRICQKNKKQCRLPVYNDLPSGTMMSAPETSSCAPAASELAKINQLIQLSNKHEKSLNDMAVHMKRATLLFRKMAPLMKQLNKIAKALKPVIKKSRPIIKGIGKTMKPIGLACKEMQKIFKKKICIVKGKCTRIKSVMKKMGKYAKKITKPVEKKIDKIVKPVLKKILKKVPIPGLGKLEKPAKKFTSIFNKVDALSSQLDVLQKLSFTNFKTQLVNIGKGIPAP